MNIVFVAQPIDKMTPPVRAGSLALWISYMGSLLVKHGHDVAIIGNNGNRFAPAFATHQGARYILTPTFVDGQINRIGRLGARFKALTGYSRHTEDYLSSDWYYSEFGRTAARYARELGADVVHIVNFSQLAPVIRRHNRHCKVVLHMQCEWLTQFPRSAIESRLSYVDLVVGCSEYITKSVSQAFPQFASRCVTVPNSANVVSDIDIGEPVGKRVLFVGRLSPEKGLHDLLAAFHLVLERVPEATLHLVGGAGSLPLEYLVGFSEIPFVRALERFYGAPTRPDGIDPYLGMLQELAGVELGRRIFFEGPANHDEISDRYRTASVLVNPSLSESFGISLVEAMMMRVPVVATRVGGMSYTVISGQTGFLVEPANPAALAEAICRVLQCPELARDMGLKGQKRAQEHFSWESSADLLLRAYGRALEKHAG